MATCSIGVSVSDEGPLDMSSLLGQADQALYSAKERGRNRCELAIARTRAASRRLDAVAAHHADAGADPPPDRIIAPTRIRSAPFSAIITVGALVLPLTISGMIDASTTRKFPMPRTRNNGSTTAIASIPILQVPTG